MMIQRIIGGMFGLPDAIGERSTAPPFIYEHSILLVNARSGLSLLTEFILPPKIWLPSYLCHTIVDGVLNAGGKIEFYALDSDLRPLSYDWLQKVGAGDLIVWIDYFGWPCDDSFFDMLRKSGAFILEDACQAMLSEGIGKHSDFVLVSPRKFLGVPDGAVLTAQNNRFDLSKASLMDPPGEWWLQAFMAMVLRREFDVHGEPNRWYELYKSMDAAHPIGRYAMSQLSHILLMRGFDYDSIAERRIANYEILASQLGEFALFPERPPGVVPLGFPIRTEYRDQLRQALFKEYIYPPIHWLIQDVVPAQFNESHKLAQEIMTLPCDQRYAQRDMERIAKLVRRELKL